MYKFPKRLFCFLLTKQIKNLSLDTFALSSSLSADRLGQQDDIDIIGTPNFSVTGHLNKFRCNKHFFF